MDLLKKYKFRGGLSCEVGPNKGIYGGDSQWVAPTAGGDACPTNFVHWPEACATDARPTKIAQARRLCHQ